MQERTKKILIIASAGVLGLFLLACNGDGTGGGSEPGHKVCDTRITTAPAAVKVADKVVIRTTTRSECDVAPVAHVVHITMEYRADKNSTWQLRYRPDVCREVPYPGHPVTCQVNGFGICQPGYWRTKVLVTGSGPDGKAFSFELPEKPQTKISNCPK